MKPEQIIAFFSEVLNQKPELFQGDVLKDLTRLEMSLDETETDSIPERLESINDAVIDFCEVNPEIYTNLQELESKPEFNKGEYLGEESLEKLTSSVNKLLDLQFLNRSEL